MAQTEDVRERLRGIVLVVLSASLFAGVDGLSKVLTETQSVGQIVWARYAMALPVAILTTPRIYWRTMFVTSRPLSQLVRGITPLGVSITMVLAVRYLPLAEATVILFAAPFLVVALSAPVLGERVHASSWIGVIVGFAAVTLVARPGFGTFSAYVVFPLAAAAFYALYQLVTRWLSNTGERPHTTLAWTLATGAVVATPFAILTWVPVTPRAWILMASLGIVFGLAQALMVRAFSHAPAGVLAPFTYTQIVAATVLGVLAFGSVPDGLTFLGVAMVITAGIYVIKTQAR